MGLTYNNGDGEEGGGGSSSGPMIASSAVVPAFKFQVDAGEISFNFGSALPPFV